MSKTEKLKTASVLAFQRKLCNSDALMYSGSWSLKDTPAAWEELKLQHKNIRGTISNRLTGGLASDPLKLDAEIQKPNLQTVDVASIPFGADTLKLIFTLRVLGDLPIPSTCNNQEYQKVFSDKIGSYLKEQKCKELSLRYASNLASGRFLWRNRIGADALQIRVSQIDDSIVTQNWSFNAFEFSLKHFSKNSDPQIIELAKTLQAGLMGESSVLLKIEAFARMGPGQEVFPSQELVLDNGNDKKSKILYAVNNVAAMHSQKIGNAIRTIDTWYPCDEDPTPISAEPYGSVTSRGTAYRHPKDKMGFYTILDNWIIKDITPSIEQQHYVVACLIRGGVYGKKADKKDEN